MPCASEVWPSQFPYSTAALAGMRPVAAFPPWNKKRQLKPLCNDAFTEMGHCLTS